MKDKSTLHSVFKTNLGYSTITIPVVEVEGGVLLNTVGRFFNEDIPYGLVILKEIAGMMGINTPAFDKMIEWHQQFMNKQFIINGKLNPDLLHETGAPSRYNINTIEQLIALNLNNNPKL